MISVSDDLRALMTSGAYQRADLYTLSLINGTVLRLTSWQTAIVSGGHVFAPALRVGGDRKWKVATGLEVDTFNVTISVDPTNELAISGVPFRQAARGGLLSGAQLEMDWAYLSNGVLVGTLPRFVGFVGQVVPDRLGVQITVNSPLKLLDIQVPTKLYAPRCRWTLGDADCGINLPSFAVSGTVGTGATQSAVPCSLTNAAGYFNQGTVTFTSGQNTGLKRQIRDAVPGMLSLATPLPFAPAAADTISATPGCDHTVPQLAAMLTVPPGTAAYTTIQYVGRGGAAISTVHPAVNPVLTVAPGSSGYVDKGVVYASGPHTGQAFALVAAPKKPAAGQYAVAANVYTFALADAGVSITVNFATSATNVNATCATVFNNVARNGAIPFIPAPETAF